MLKCALEGANLEITVNRARAPVNPIFIRLTHDNLHKRYCWNNTFKIYFQDASDDSFCNLPFANSGKKKSLQKLLKCLGWATFEIKGVRNAHLQSFPYRP